MNIILNVLQGMGEYVVSLSLAFLQVAKWALLVYLGTLMLGSVVLSFLYNPQGTAVLMIPVLGALLTTRLEAYYND